MNDVQHESDKSANHWTTLFAISTHAMLWFVCLIELMMVPRFIATLEDFDAQLPALTSILLNLYAASQSFWYLLWLTTVGLMVLDSVIFYRLFRNPRFRWLGVLWFFAVLIALVVFSILLTTALFLPLLDLMSKMS